MAYDWTKTYLIPRSNIEFWHQFQPGVSGHQIIYDVSGKNRHIACDVSNSPQLTVDIANQQPAWYFNGARLPLAFTGNVTLRHLFIVATFEDAVFPNPPDNSGFKGLFTGINTGDVLVGYAGTDKFYDFSHSTYTYRKSNVVFTADNQKVPVSNQLAVIEIIKEDGFFLDGIQIGQHRQLTDRRWKGFFVEDLGFSVVRTDEQRLMIYQYFAERYHLWQKNSSGLNVFPFQNDIDGIGEKPKQLINFYDPPEGDRISEVLNNSKRAIDLKFSSADQYEVKAMQKFHAQHYATALPCVFRDYRFNPSEDIIGYIDSDYDLNGANNNFDYSFRFKEK